MPRLLLVVWRLVSSMAKMRLEYLWSVWLVVCSSSVILSITTCILNTTKTVRTRWQHLATSIVCCGGIDCVPNKYLNFLLLLEDFWDPTFTPLAIVGCAGLLSSWLKSIDFGSFIWWLHCPQWQALYVFPCKCPWPCHPSDEAKLGLLVDGLYNVGRPSPEITIDPDFCSTKFFFHNFRSQLVIFSITIWSWATSGNCGISLPSELPFTYFGPRVALTRPTLMAGAQLVTVTFSRWNNGYDEAGPCHRA